MRTRLNGLLAKSGESVTPRASCEECPHLVLERRHQLGLEPRILPEPAVVAPGRVRHRQDARAARRRDDRTPALYGRGEAGLAIWAEMPALRVSADREDQLEPRQRGEDRSAPSLGAFAPRRQIAALGVLTREARRHRNDRDAPRIVEDLLRDAEPGPQPHARGVGEGAAARMRARSGRLARDAQPGAGAGLDYRTRLVRERRTVTRLVAADAAGAQPGDD